jgi:solute carrier family 35 protein F1/2
MRGWAAPTTQTFFLYFILFVIYTPWTVYRYGLRAWAEMIFKDGWKCAGRPIRVCPLRRVSRPCADIILAAVDVEGNYTVVKAYQYTDLLSAELLDAWAIPVCMLVVWFLVKIRYRASTHLSHRIDLFVHRGRRQTGPNISA